MGWHKPQFDLLASGSTPYATAQLFSWARIYTRIICGV